MWRFDKEKEKTLRSLCDSYGPTSYEQEAQKIVLKAFEEIGMICEGDSIGNLYTSLLPNSDFQIGIVAHIDEVALQITSVTDEGLLRFRKLGGIRATSLIGHKVMVLTCDGYITGVVGCDPLQNNGTETGIIVKTSDLWIDVGASDKEEANQMVAIGDYALFKSEFDILGENRIVSKALDDRLGIFVMLEAMRQLKDCNLQIGVTAISTVQEEINLQGSTACTKKMNAAIVIDVDFATDIPTKHSQMGYLALGKGVGMNKNADSNVILQTCMTEVARRHDIPVQTTLGRNITGGTDAAKLRLKGDMATLNLNIPLRYMHTHSEICDRRDIEYTVRAVVELIKYINTEDVRSFVPWQNRK